MVEFYRVFLDFISFAHGLGKPIPPLATRKTESGTIYAEGMSYPELTPENAQNETT